MLFKKLKCETQGEKCYIGSREGRSPAQVLELTERKRTWD